MKIWSIILGIGLIAMAIYTINQYSKSGATTFNKIIVDAFAVIFIIAGIVVVWKSFKQVA